MNDVNHILLKSLKLIVFKHIYLLFMKILLQVELPEVAFKQKQSSFAFIFVHKVRDLVRDLLYLGVFGGQLICSFLDDLQPPLLKLFLLSSGSNLLVHRFGQVVDNIYQEAKGSQENHDYH